MHTPPQAQVEVGGLEAGNEECCPPAIGASSPALLSRLAATPARASELFPDPLALNRDERGSGPLSIT